jgi:hypothetical protein
VDINGDGKAIFADFAGLDWRSLLEPIINRYRGYDILRFFRGDAAFADPKMYCYLETEEYFYTIRLQGKY